MNAQTLQIVKAYEELHLDLPTIAEEQEVSLTEIKVILIQFSSIYRRDVRAENKEQKRTDEFTDDESLLIRDAMMNLCQSTEDENLKFRILKYARDDKKGRKDVATGIQGIQVNLALFNQQVKRMRDAASQVMGISSTNDQKKVIDV